MKPKKYLLDTNVLIELMAGNPTITRKAIDTGLENCCMSAISLHELYFGAFNATRRSEKHYIREVVRIKKLTEKISVLDLPGDAAEHYGRIKFALARIGKPVDEFDIVIAGHALCEGLTVVTDNIKHFENMPDVEAENWM